MGKVYKLYCDNCGYELEATLGVGFLFPRVYKETLDEARDGKLGDRIQTFLREHPDGAIDCSLVLAQCIYCGQYETVHDLTMYLPKKKLPTKDPNQRWSIAMPFCGADYVAPWDLREYYKAFATYPHTCKHCGGDMKLIPEKTFERRRHSLKCPNCRSKLNEGLDVILWD